jgi:hypothetical protein
MPELLALVATLLTATFLVPQIVRIISREDTAGLSAFGPDSGWSPTWRGLHMSGSRISGSPPSPRLWRSWHTRSHRSSSCAVRRDRVVAALVLVLGELAGGRSSHGPDRSRAAAAEALLWGGYGWLVADLLSSGTASSP